MFGIDCNRRFPLKKGQWFFNCVYSISGKAVSPKDFGFVQLFKTQLKEQQRFYIVYQDEDNLLSF